MHSTGQPELLRSFIAGLMSKPVSPSNNASPYVSHSSWILLKLGVATVISRAKVGLEESS